MWGGHGGSSHTDPSSPDHYAHAYPFIKRRRTWGLALYSFLQQSAVLALIIFCLGKCGLALRAPFPLCAWRILGMGV